MDALGIATVFALLVMFVASLLILSLLRRPELVVHEKDIVKRSRPVSRQCWLFSRAVRNRRSREGIRYQVTRTVTCVPYPATTTSYC
jgi:hypothetical protein